MGGELLNASLTPDPSTDDSNPRKTMASIFDEFCPYYMSIGMTYDEYWNGPNELCRYFRKAHELREKREDANAWMQGRYIYEAIGALAPILRTNLSSKEVSAKPYVEKPYLVQLEDQKKAEIERQKNHMMSGLAFMQMFTDGFNKKWEAKQKAKEENSGDQMGEEQHG